MYCRARIISFWIWGRGKAEPRLLGHVDLSWEVDPSAPLTSVGGHELTSRFFARNNVMLGDLPVGVNEIESNHDGFSVRQRSCTCGPIGTCLDLQNLQ